jgi:hypothetical protein
MTKNYFTKIYLVKPHFSGVLAQYNGESVIKEMDYTDRSYEWAENWARRYNERFGENISVKIS